MNKKSVFSLLFLFSIFTFGFSIVEACSCVQMSSCEAFARAEIVFTGKIVKAVDTEGSRKHQVQVEETFLGLENTPLVDVFTDTASSCMFTMTKGEDYLIFAWRNKETGALWTGMCSHTAQTEDAGEDLKYLRSVKTSGKSGATIRGVVRDAEIENAAIKPEQIDKVFIENADGEKFETAIESDGSYSLSGLIAGKYRIFVTLPKGYITNEEASPFVDEETNKKFIEIAGRGCTVNNIGVRINGTISGKIIDANGLPVKDRNVNLLRLADPNKIETQPEMSEPFADAEPETEETEEDNQATAKTNERKAVEVEADYDAYTDEDGFYIFKGLPPGRYLLGVGIDNYFSLNGEKDQYVPTYFPSSKRRETAVIIELKKAEILTDKNIQLFPKLKRRKIAGQIVWKNGRAEPKAEGEIYAKREGVSRADWIGRLQINAKGNFLFDGYEETEYLIKVWFTKPTDQNSSEITHSAKCFIVPKNGAVNSLKLTLENGSSNCNEEPFRDR